MLILAALALGVCGCGRWFKSPQWLGFGGGGSAKSARVLPRGGGEPTELGASDIIAVCRRIGFLDEQILDLGPTLRDALRTSGAAAVVTGKHVEAMFAINNGYMFVQSRSQGGFVYDIEDKRFGVVPPMRPE